MGTVNVTLGEDAILNVMVGQQDENEVREVVFDFSDWYTTYGSGTISLAIQRPKDEWPYEGTLTVDNSTHKATWEISDTDSAYAGVGQIQLSYTVGTAVKKSVVYRFTVHKSLGALGSVITPIQIQTFIDEVTEALEDMQDELADVKEELQDLQEEIEGGGSGMSTAFKQALHNILEKVAYIDDDGQDYLDALDEAMYPPVTAIRLNTNSLSFSTLNSTQQLTATTTPMGGDVTWSSSDTSVATVSSSGLVTGVGYGNATITATSGSVSATCSVVVAQATITSISAVYTQSGIVYDTDSLDSLKDDLVVTAHWSNSTTSTVPSTDYVLIGTLTEGTSTITVNYGGKTTTFNVEVTNGQYIPIGIRAVDLNITGLTKEATNRATTNIIRVTGGQSITVTSSAFYLRVAQYDINKNFLPHYLDIGDLTTTTATGTLNASCAYIRVTMKKSDNSDITEQEMLASTLTIDGVSWDLIRTTETNGTFILKVAKRAISPTTGEYTESNIRVSTDMVPLRNSAGNILMTTTSGEYIKGWTYKSDGTFNNGQGTFNSTSVTINFVNGMYYFRLTFKNSDDSEFTDADMLSITGTLGGIPFVVEESSV